MSKELIEKLLELELEASNAPGELWILQKAIEIVRQHGECKSEAAHQAVDWTEDFEERGNYQCKCRQCGCVFNGHKARALCKVCALPPCPDIEPIRKLAREVGYAVGEHGSKVRDYDLIAALWTDEAVGNYALIEHLCKGLNAKVVDGPSRKPCGRYAVCIQISDRWLKHIDLSIMPRATKRESVEPPPPEQGESD
jgi:hypothetical protein